MINPFGYAQASFFPWSSLIPQRVVGLPIQSTGAPVQYVTIPVEAVSPRILPTTALINPLALTAHPAYWQTTPFFGGLPTYGVQGLPTQQAFGVPQAGIQGVPVSQTYTIPGLPAQHAFGVQTLQAPHAIGGVPIQSVSLLSQPVFDLASALFTGVRPEFLPMTQAVLAETQVPRAIGI